MASGQRLRILLALREQPLCVSVMTDLLHLAAATVSKHLWILARAGLVESEKTGRCVCYRLPGRGAPAEIRKTLHWILDLLAHNPRILEDQERLKPLIKESPVETWCQERSTSRRR